MKKLFTLLFLSGVFAGCSADSGPVAGIWKHLPVANSAQKAVARTNYIFTEQALTEKTVFSALQDNTNGYKVVCCVEVVNLTPVDLKAVTSKYKGDPDFVEAMGSVKGARFVYEAQPVAKKDWSPELVTIAAIDANPDDLSPFSAPVISGKMAKRQIASNFDVGGKKVQLKNVRDKVKGTVTYQFTIDNRMVRLSEQEEPAE